MTRLFSTKGTVSRQYFIFCLMAYLLAVPLGIAICMVISLLSKPGAFQLNGYFWSEGSAGWVRDHLGWFIQGWQVVLPAVCLYLLADRIFSYAYVRRARAIGVEISVGEVYYCFMGFERGATLNDLLQRSR